MGARVVSGRVDVLDLFCGCGGLSLGFARHNSERFRVIGGIDTDRHACTTYEAEIGAPAVVADVEGLLDSEHRSHLLQKLRPMGGGPLVVVGGPPCQGFSAHRKKDIRSDERNSLVNVFFDAAVSFSADFIIMENVPEVFDDRYWPNVRKAIAKTEEAGYRVRAQVHDLSNFGVPQSRFRAIIVARRAGGCFNMPEPNIHQPRTVRDAIGTLPVLNAGDADPNDSMHVAPGHTDRVMALIRSVPADGGSRKAANVELLPSCHRTVDGFRDVYGRLWWDRPAISITAKSSTPSCGRFLHPEQHRNISVREAALLQGFPEDFVVSGPLVQKYRQIGNAVSPMFSAVLADTVLREIDSPSTVLLRSDQDVVHSQGRSFTSSIASRKRAKAATRARSLRAIDLFCGAGGLSLGLRAAGFDVRLAVDHDPDAIATYRYNLGDHAVEADVVSLGFDRIRELAGVRIGELDLLAAGPPCQGFSQQRRGSDDDARNDLVKWFGDAVVAIRPKAFLLENVPYLAAKRGREFLATFLKAVTAAGYAVSTSLLNASTFGVAQSRLRFVAIGIRDGAAPDLARMVQLRDRPRTVEDAIRRLPKPDEPGVPHSDYPNHVRAKISKLNELRISYVPPGGGWKDIPADLQLECHKLHKGHGHLDVFGRLVWTEPATTITAHSDSFSRGRYAHPEDNRPLTGRELAALQSFPMWYNFRADRKSVARLIGNAVPPLMGKALGLAISDRLLQLPKIESGQARLLDHPSSREDEHNARPRTGTAERGPGRAVA